MRHHIYSPFYSRNPFSLRRSAAVMFTAPPPLRGRSSHSRLQRYSDRSQPSSTVSTAVVSGESHFQSVRDINSSLQRHHPHNNNSNNNEGNQLGLLNNKPRSSPFYGNPNPSMNTNMNQLVAKTRPPDYRIWEFAHPPPPPNAERFVVLSYNILADYLANSHRNLYHHIPRRFMSWDWRKNNLLFELGLWSADIMCFQEVDKFDELEQGLRDRGYSGVWKMRTGDPIDGCATFWRTSRFKLVYEECIEFNKLSMRDNVAQICVLESLKENQSGKKLASSESSTGRRNRVVICNIHVLYNPKRGEMKLGQVRVLLERAQEVSKKWDDAPVILCGDFNCVPKSPLYNFISGQKLDLSELDRANVSGQASADLRQSPNQFGNQTRGQSTGAITSSVVIENGKKMTSENNPNAPESILENPPTIKRISQFSSESPLNFPLSGVSEKYCRDFLIASIENTSRNVSNDNMKDGGHNSTNEGTSAESGDQSDISQRIFSSESDDINMLSVAGDMNSDAVDSEAKPGLANKYVEAVEDVVEDAEAFMSELNDNKDAFPSNLGVVGDPSFTRQSELLNKPSYDPSSWTPMEIATATGDANNTVLQHSLKLSSTYTEVQDRSGTRDSNGEPLVTSYHSCFMGTVDYIWRSEGLRTVKVLAPIPKSAMLPTKGFPSKKWGSDHIALASELAFTK